MILKRDFNYPAKNANRPLHIWLPDDYYDCFDFYPVMYFFDGHNLFLDEDATYGKSWGMKEFLETWGKRMIIVGIECGHDGYERLSEYLPYPANKGSHFDRFTPMGDEKFTHYIKEYKNNGEATVTLYDYAGAELGTAKYSGGYCQAGR